MSWTAATIVAKDMLAHARVLARSLAEQHPEVALHVLLADEPEDRFDPSGEPFTTIPLDALGPAPTRLLRFRYDRQQLSYALTPALAEHLLDQGHERVVFVKQESLVLGRLDPLLDPLENAGAVLTPHLLDPLEGPDAVDRELTILLSGTFNLGTFAVSSRGRPLLAWWRDRLARHCRRDVAAGLHFEQRWMDLAPALFEGVHVLRDPTVNVGHWNLRERAVDVRDGVVLAGGEPCRLFRFSGYDPAEPERVTRYVPERTLDAIGTAGDVFRRFARLLAEAGHEECRRWPYAYATFDDGVPVFELARELHAGLTDEEAARFGDPLMTGPGSFAEWLRSGGGNGVPPLWRAVLDRRTDVRLAHPDPGGADRERFRAWAFGYGCPELGIPTAFAP